MHASEDRVFYFHADANPVGGHVSEPVPRIVETQASVSLAQAGGHVRSDVGRFVVDGLIATDRAHSEVYGVQEGRDGSWTTMVTSVVEGLNILDVVHVGRVVAKMTVRHPAKGHYPSVSFRGSHFLNFTIGGKVVTPHLDLTTFARTVEQSEAATEHWDANAELVEAAAEKNRKLTESAGAPNWLKSRYGWMHEEAERAKRGHVTCSLVTEVQGAEPNHVYGHVIHIPEVGNLFLGELGVNRGAFHLTMLRIEMGCLTRGTVSVANNNSNGSMYP